MKPATIIEIKKELKFRTQEQLIEYCLKMARFKLESKELLTYLVFESENETVYVDSVKTYITVNFQMISATNFYYIKKSVRKIIRQTKRFIRYSKIKETEVELLLHFCKELVTMKPSIRNNRMLTNMYNKQLEMAMKVIDKLHEDLQYDFEEQLKELPQL